MRLPPLPPPVVAAVSTPDPDDDECFWHGPERPRVTDYRVCGECGHRWRSAGEWVAAVHQLCREMSWPVVDDCDFCTYCAHSF